MSAPRPVHILVLSGPNTNLYGLDPHGPYGALTLDDIAQACRAGAQAQGGTVDFRQSNSEGELVDWVQQARGTADGIVINAGSLSYTSIALRDALAAIAAPAIQVHVSNVFTREPFRHHSPLSSVVTGCIFGLGPDGYAQAVAALIAAIRRAD
ncbi:type II 3-dehydroquinate dehydratase [Ancylobacter amanitiformis]|uniref:3-dehydroquinate dehydratase n=1 Tax=Ancylobacter amanitiformis TaxID=217069 RepID=A0ABU0LST1_9HYPH|nr:type II 3-dehydroquinate dehydratase [Ancylobacter amanitiformis]MDQ0511648.1 3-dehydroquinate dehydratase-2 [Ancylobacter amanitiformis]